MTATTTKYRTPHTSERTFAVKNLCRLLVLVGARAHETNGEQLIRKDGKPYTHTGRKGLAAILRKHAAKRRAEPALEAKGFNRDQALYAYHQVFETGRAYASNPTPEEMKKLSKDGWFISVSGNTNDVPNASDLDDYVNDVPHEIGVLPYPNDYGPLVLEPMRPRGAGLVRVSWTALWKFSNEFAANGRRHCIIVRAGWDTAARRRTRELNAVYTKDLNRVRDQRDEALDLVKEQKGRITSLVNEVDAVTTQLTECQQDGCDAATEALLDALHAWEMEQRL